MRNTILGLLGLSLTGMFLTGCNSFPSEWKTKPIADSSALTGKAAIVVPVKGPPISLQDSQFWSSVFGGIAGALIQESVDKPKRDALVKKVAGQSSAFSPEVVLAEECADLLKRSGWVSGTNVTLYKGLEIIHGAGPEIEGETRVFKTTMTSHEVKSWHNAYSLWMRGGPVHNFSASEVGSDQFVSLELTTESVLITKAFYIGAWMRLMDPVSGKSLASGFAHDKFSVHAIKSAADLDIFLAEYRKCARRVSETLLKQLKLIP